VPVSRPFRLLSTPSLPDVSRSFAGPPRGQSVDDVYKINVTTGDVEAERSRLREHEVFQPQDGCRSKSYCLKKQREVSAGIRTQQRCAVPTSLAPLSFDASAEQEATDVMSRPPFESPEPIAGESSEAAELARLEAGSWGPTSMNEPNVGSTTQKSGLCDRGPLLREDASEHVRRRRARTHMDPDRAASKVLLELDLTSSCKRWPLHCTSHCPSDLQSVGHVCTWRYLRHSASVSERVTRPFAISITSSRAIACTTIRPSE
jgi:hypothetical protein